MSHKPTVRPASHFRIPSPSSMNQDGDVAQFENDLPEYEGHIYIDVPMEDANPTYQKLLSHFENEDGSPKDPECALYFHPLVDTI